jgi:hypothetical protein
VYLNPEQVVCVLDVGDLRTQVVTTGLSGEASMTLIVEAPLNAVVKALRAGETAEPCAAPPPGVNAAARRAAASRSAFT